MESSSESPLSFHEPHKHRVQRFFYGIFYGHVFIIVVVWNFTQEDEKQSFEKKIGKKKLFPPNRQINCCQGS